MKMSDELAVVCDHRTVESSLALRGVLEHFQLGVRLHRLVQLGEALNSSQATRRPAPTRC
jgi:hypothetical protein